MMQSADEMLRDLTASQLDTAQDRIRLLERRQQETIATLQAATGSELTCSVELAKLAGGMLSRSASPLARLEDLANRHGLEACELKPDANGAWRVTGHYGADPKASHLACGATAAAAVEDLRLIFEPLLTEATAEQLLTELEERLNMKREEARELMRLAHEELL